jgi:hypothetical protein
MGTKPHERPEWKTILIDANNAAVNALSEEQREARIASIRASREKARHRREAKRAKIERIDQGMRDGETVAEIAAALKIPPTTLRSYCADQGITLSARHGHRQRRVWVAFEHDEALRALADDMGVALDRALERLVGIALNEGAREARRMLHVKPKRA